MAAVSVGRAGKILTTIVTGAAGFAGGHLLDRLTGQGRVIAWSRPQGTAAGSDSNVTWQAVDVTDRAAVTAAIKKSRPDRIFHLAGAASVESSWVSAVPHLRTNVMGTANLLDAARRAARPCRIVVVTSGQIYAASDDPIAEDGRLFPQSPYALSKLAQDQLASATRDNDPVDVMIARPFNHIGPRQAGAYAVASFARQIASIERGLAAPVLSVGNLETRRDITDVRDVVDAYARIMDGGQPGHAYNVCSGRAWRIRDLLDELLQIAAVPIRVEIDPARLRPMDVPIVQGDATRMRAALGWTPTISVEQTLRDTLDYWRTRIAAES